MIIPRSRKSYRKQPLGIDEPLRHENHRKPVTRRDFLAQGFIAGSGTVIAPAALSLLFGPHTANAALSDDIQTLLNAVNCNVQNGAGKVPFICFDLAGGCNIAGSNALVGQNSDQMNFLSTAGYSKLGIPGNMLPNPASVTGTFIDQRLGLAFHSDSAFLRGMATRMSATTMAGVNGFVIPARSENDTGNNPHNPMYGIATTGARGALLTLIGSQNTDSGGNSMAPLMMIDPTRRPTKIDRSSDATGLVDTGELATLLPSQADTVAVMESMERISDYKLGTQTPPPPIMPVNTELGPTGDAAAKKLVKCAYVKVANQAENFASSAVLDPRAATDIIVGPTTPGAIFTTAEYNSSGEYDKTASVMKLVVNGYAGAGTVTMGGFDYHTGDRMTGEARDFRAGECMGACLEYAARKGKPLMLYVFSDGSLNANAMVDNSVGGRGKLSWQGDNQGTACSLILVYSPTGRPAMLRNQVGSFTAGGDVVTASSPAANAVNLLVETVILNYMALHGEEGNFQNLFPSTGLSTAQMNQVLALTRII
jgi:hypothetical protein